MALVGVLLGITMTVLVGVIGFGYKEWVVMNTMLIDHGNRINVLERRKAVVAEAVAGHPKPAGVGGQKLRTWNEDAAPAEAKG